MYLFLAVCSVAAGSLSGDSCIGEYQHCKGTGECTLFECDGPGPHCTDGQYRCPISNNCVASVSCPDDIASRAVVYEAMLDHAGKDTPAKTLAVTCPSLYMLWILFELLVSRFNYFNDDLYV